MLRRLLGALSAALLIATPLLAASGFGGPGLQGWGPAARWGTAVPWTPPALGGALAGWWDATDDATLTKSGSSVIGWSNKGNAGGTFDSSAPPTYSATGLGGHPSVVFTGGTYLDAYPSISSTVAIFAWVGLMNDAGDTYGRLISAGYSSYGDGNSAGNFALQRVATTNTAMISAANTGPTATLSYGTPVLFTWVGDGTDGYLYENGALVGSTPYPGPTSLNIISLGIGFPSGGALQKFDGAISEVLCALSSSTSDRQKIEGYEAWKYGITLTSGHPYASALPTL